MGLFVHVTVYERYAVKCHTIWSTAQQAVIDFYSIKKHLF